MKSLFCFLALALAACSGSAAMDTPLDAGSTVDGAAEPDARPPSPDAPALATITVDLTGSSTGTVVADGLALSCGPTCTAIVPVGTSVRLTASPGVGAAFAGWTGGCAGRDPSCTLTVTQDVAVSASFEIARFTVQVALAGNGSGAVTSTSDGLACPDACTITVPYNTVVQLTAAAASHSTFSGWGGACSGTGACAVTVTSDIAVTSSFTADNQLVVVRGGAGRGYVAGEGIDCGSFCDRIYPLGTSVTLTATADSLYSTFLGWSGGGCSGTGTCQVTMNGPSTVTATFGLQDRTLPIEVIGFGHGSVKSSPGITCVTDQDNCHETFPAHTMITLTATPDAGSVFRGWDDSRCPNAGTGPCVFPLDVTRLIGAEFDARP